MSTSLPRLLTVMARLRDPNGGCPWDLEQTHGSLAPYVLEEAYEVVEAIERGDAASLKEELGDLLLQVVFHAQLAKESGAFDFDAIAATIADKLVERHPHVFGEREAGSTEDVLRNWEANKEAKRAKAAEASGTTPSILDGISTALPSSTRSLKLQQRAARVGFDWPDLKDVLVSLRSELDELESEIRERNKDAMEDELGDVYFAVVNLARHLEIDPDTALRRTNRKFERRFRAIEERLAQQGRTVKNSNLEEMDRIWNEVRAAEKLAKAG